MVKQLYFIVCLCLMIILCYPGSPQEHLKYKLRDQKTPNRKEGLTRFGISAPDLELLSFTSYREGGNFKQDDTLKVKFYLPNDTLLYMTAKELIPQAFYLMKPLRNKWAKGWQEFTPWPVREVLYPLNIKSKNLGIIGRMADRVGSGEVVPLIVYYHRPPVSISQYTLYLKPKQNLSKIQYKLFRKGSQQPIKRKTYRKTFYSKMPVYIKLDLKNKSAGYFTVVVDCKVKNTISKIQRTYTFYHQPMIK